MGDLNRAEHLEIMLTAAELKFVDDWRFSRRMPSRASAIRGLLRRGLIAEVFKLAEDGSKSKNFGVGLATEKQSESARNRPTRRFLLHLQCVGVRT